MFFAKRLHFVTLPLLLLALAAVGCQPSEPVRPSATVQVAASPTPAPATATASPAPSLSLTPAPSFSPSPTAVAGSPTAAAYVRPAARHGSAGR